MQVQRAHTEPSQRESPTDEVTSVISLEIAFRILQKETLAGELQVVHTTLQKNVDVTEIIPTVEEARPASARKVGSLFC